MCLYSSIALSIGWPQKTCITNYHLKAALCSMRNGSFPVESCLYANHHFYCLRLNGYRGHLSEGRFSFSVSEDTEDWLRRVLTRYISCPCSGENKQIHVLELFYTNAHYVASHCWKGWETVEKRIFPRPAYLFSHLNSLWCCSLF